MSSERIRLEREKAQLVQARAPAARASSLGPRLRRPPLSSSARALTLARTRRPSAQGAYASGVLSEAQFSELEELQTPDCLNFVAEGAPRARAAGRRGRALYRQKRALSSSAPPRPPRVLCRLSAAAR